VTEPELSLGEFHAALLAEMEKSPTIVPEWVAAAQSRQARRVRRDAIIAERGRLFEASKQLVAREVLKISPRNDATLEDYVERRDARERELEEVRREWWREYIDETWRIPPTDLQWMERGLQWVWWAGLIAGGLSLFWIFIR
jgi:hypothetical protein